MPLKPTGTPAVYVGELQVVLGDVRRDVQAAADAGALFSSAADLRGAGFAHHHVCAAGTSAYDLARAAVAPIAARHPRFGAIIYATTLPQNATIADRDDEPIPADVKQLMRYPAARLQAEFGFVDAAVIGVGQQACTGIVGALRLARSLLVAEPYLDPILCVTADRFPAGVRYEQAYNLISDGAVACVVTTQPGDFELLGVHHITNGGLELASDDQMVASYFPATCEVISTVCARAGLRPDELDWVVTQNTHAKAAPILARMLGIAEDRMYQGTLAELGHLIAGDALANLGDLHRAGRLRSGDLIAAPVAGYGLNWQCALLRAA